MKRFRVETVGRRREKDEGLIRVEEEVMKSFYNLMLHHPD